MQERFERRQTRSVQVGDIAIGGDNPIAVQSMVTKETRDIRGVAEQIKQLHLAGAEIVRVTTPTLQDAQCLAEIKSELKRQYRDVPLAADVHHQGTNIGIEASKHVEKVRINPGLFVYHKSSARREEYSEAEIENQKEEIDQALSPLIMACKERGVALRVGVNHGSLAERLIVMYGDTPEGMVQSAMEYLRICESNGYKDVVVSLKASRVPVMVAANRLMVQRMETEEMHYPIHLGVTEAGKDQYARVKSSYGIGTLLSEGIGDTIRVSLAEDPIKELTVCYDILQAGGLRHTKAELIACPSCGRTKFDLETVTDEIFGATEHLKGLSIAVMGCIVNGPGEMADADYGFVGLGGGKIALYRGKEVVNTVQQETARDSLIALIKEDGKWINPPTFS